MADNWSASTVTLTNEGDWAKWTMDVPDDATRDDMNVATTLSAGFRGALSGPSLSAVFGLVVNDTVFFGSMDPTLAFSTAGWISADRFVGLGSGGGITWSAAEFPYNGPSFDFEFTTTDISDAAPFVTGTNTIRLLSFGRNFDHASEPIEVDFVAISVNAGTGSTTTNSDSIADTPPAYFAAHVNPDPDPLDPFAGPLWLLKAPDATTGTAAASVITVEKFCAAVGGGVNTKVRLTGAGDPISGTVWVYDQGTLSTQSASVDGNGEATFVLSDNGDATYFYGGSDDWAPCMFTVDKDDRIGCGSGWYLGQIVMAS